MCMAVVIVVIINSNARRGRPVYKIKCSQESGESTISQLSKLSITGVKMTSENKSVFINRDSKIK